MKARRNLSAVARALGVPVGGAAELDRHVDAVLVALDTLLLLVVLVCLGCEAEVDDLQVVAAVARRGR